MSAIRKTGSPVAPRALPAAPASKSTKATTVASAGGWSAKGLSPQAQAKRLSAFLKSADGQKTAKKIIHDAVKKNFLGKDLKFESGKISKVTAEPGGKTFMVDVQVKVGGQINYFNAIVDAKGKVVSVPQG